MEPSKLQKNAGIIADLKDVRRVIDESQVRLQSRYNSDATNRAINLLRYASNELLDRMVELGVVIKIEDGSNA